MTMTSDTPIDETGVTERFNLKDGQRPITFEGCKIAEADSQGGEDKRWTELAIYLTASGKYVLEKVGRSDVFHSPLCKRRSKGKEYPDLDEAIAEIDPEGDEEVEDRFIPCEDCTPDFDIAPAWVEQDIPSVVVVATARELVQSLYRDSGATKFLSRVARAVLEQAAKANSDIATVMNVPTDVT